MRFFQLRPFAAPKRFCFKDPDTGKEYLEDTRPMLVRSIVTYRDQNGLEPIPYLDKVLENYWSGLPENIDIRQLGPELKRDFKTYLKGGVALIGYVFEPSTVDDGTANTRANQCVECPGNVFPDKGAFMRFTDRVAEEVVGKDKHVKLHDALGNCLGCSCVLKAKVWVKGPFDLSADEQKTMLRINKDCWQLKESKPIPASRPHTGKTRWRIR